MIIWGSKPITGTTNHGNFNCPVCAQSRSFEQKRVRRFFTLYFIPLFPTSTLGEYVECRQCQGTFAPDVLSYDPAVESQKAEAFFMIAVKQMMISVCLADGEIDEQEVAKIQEIYQQLTGAQVSIQDLQEEIAAISQNGSPLFEMIDQFAGTLNDKGKETAIRSAYLIAAADGHVSDDEVQLIQQIAARMGVSNAHLNGIFASLSAEN